ncbi:Acetyltransferase (GNAT) family protein [Nocardioides alpinus]|uniref:Acetyltransferase (GNAT) family protein n=1 Tax=Nocardioides alpinus TaxID=748909 RepID=A0A1I1B0Y3_9ACTN|nr:GNAT family N-acetyltransferase [Nocardioides alpinus]PKH41398.1 GNAT family N-acetyltransferase [Nocardioides alpinus]SFB43931.1 Acetyltransferase (GNAT) family protein [Nocardioides alpinus]
MADVEVVHGAPDGAVSDEIWPLYRSIFSDFEDVRAWRDGVWDRHSARPGFRLALAREGETLVGFAYGYTGGAGQWWTDRAATVLHPVVASDWLGGHFELVSIGAAGAARGAGVGRQLITALTAGLPQSRWVLMTSADPDDPARRLYRSTGWAVIGPGFSDDQVIMGRALPL